MYSFLDGLSDIREVRLVLGDQLNVNHSWFQQVDTQVLYVLCEVKSETNYVTHHIQKVVGIFAAMRQFANQLKEQGHTIFYKKINQNWPIDSLEGVVEQIAFRVGASTICFQEPDEYRVDVALRNLSKNFAIKVYSTEHFFTERNTLKQMFEGKKTYLMERFYREMRKKHQVLMHGEQPIGERWNFDADNRMKFDKKVAVPKFIKFDNDIAEVFAEIQEAQIETIGKIQVEDFQWPISNKQAIATLNYFVSDVLPFFGKYQDAMVANEPFLFHSRLSFALNLKLICPKEVVEAVVSAFKEQPEKYGLATIEGFVRQILGWREFMRGIYWAEMPEFAKTNFLENQNPLPSWFWNAKTKMNCVHHAIKQSLDLAYAHHIQRLMIIGNFALLAGISPTELDKWYLGIYIDAFEWVEITNTRGMSQFADGGLLATKPYVSSANYIQKMSDYCKNCEYNPKLRVGPGACPFNSLYWQFFVNHEDKLAKNPRIGMAYQNIKKMKAEELNAIATQAQIYMQAIERI